VNELLQAKIDVFESGYEFLLAYAAQGRDTDGGADSEVRTMLSDMTEAAAEILHLLEQNRSEYAWVVEDDSKKARAAISLVLAQPEISSELVDNLNVSIHLRALLTDLFLVSETSL
jgi:ribulose bisphosphate carboxylase small subunit